MNNRDNQAIVCGVCGQPATTMTYDTSAAAAYMPGIVTPRVSGYYCQEHSPFSTSTPKNDTSIEYLARTLLAQLQQHPDVALSRTTIRELRRLGRLDERPGDASDWDEWAWDRDSEDLDH